MDADAGVRESLTPPPRHFPALVAYAAITVALTWPLATSLGRVVPFDLGDSLLTAAILWWNADHLPFTAAWWDGAFFFPASDNLALSDHRVGISVLTTPLIWLGMSPLGAYGLIFLLTWFLSASTAYALVWTVTSSRAAAFIGGLVFGFNPFRAAHLAHLELLASYWLPVSLLALHQWLATRRNGWLFVLSVALLLQALTSGYYFFFLAILIALWLVWFGRGLTGREYARLAVALMAPAILISPVLAHYRQVHETVGLARSLDEIKRFSADLIGFVTAPEPLALWNSPPSWRRPEGELMPGLTAVLLVVAVVVAGRGRRFAVPTPRLVSLLRRALLVLAIAAIVVAILPWVIGPIGFDLGRIDFSSRGQDKPLGVAFLCVMLWLASSRPFIAAFTSRSVFGFYCVAALIMWLMALGPEGRFLGHPVLYKPPYAWLMSLPGFEDSFRAPARFAMLAVLALSVAAGVAVVQLLARFPDRTGTATAVIAAAILAESWIYPFPVAAAPPPLEVPNEVPVSAVVLEVPTGVYEDALSMFHATWHHRRTINGMSGYAPPHYKVLTRALGEGNLDVLDVLRRYADVAVFSRRDRADAAHWVANLRARAGATPLPDTSTHQVTLVRMQPPPAESPPRVSDEVRHLATVTQPPSSSPARLYDDDLFTAWVSGAPQRGTEMITLTLDQRRVIGGICLESGLHSTAFARAIAVDVSEDGLRWDTVATADGAAAALEAALRDPRRTSVTLSFEPRAAVHVRVRQLGTSQDEWAVAELRVLAR